MFLIGTPLSEIDEHTTLPTVLTANLPQADKKN